MAEKIDLLLVNPGNRIEQFANLNSLATVAQPLGLALLASYVRDRGVSVKIIDAEAEGWTPEETMRAIQQYEPLLLGVSAFTTKMTAAGHILRLVSDIMPQVKTVIGGHHPSAIPAETLMQESVNFVVQGEGYKPLLALVSAIKQGDNNYIIPGVWHFNKSAIGYKQHELANLDILPSPAWDLLPMVKYRAHHWQTWDNGCRMGNFAVIYTSLGCPFSCDYCSVNVVYGEHRTRFRDIDSVVKEIEELVNVYGVKYIEIIDDTFTLHAPRTLELCWKLAHVGLAEKVFMWAFARVDRMSLQLAHALRGAGIRWIFMGLESGKDIILQGVNKQQTIEQTKKAVDVAHSAGLHVGGNYVFGLPGDDFASMQATLDLALDLNTEYANFFLTMAYPGTKLREVALQKGYPLPSKWSQYGFFTPDAMPMRTEALTSEEIVQFRDKAFLQYFGGERYLGMVERTFGSHVREFVMQGILGKQLVRE